MQQQETVLLLK